MRRLLIVAAVGILAQIPLGIAWISRQVHLTTKEVQAAVSPLSEISLSDLSSEREYHFRMRIPTDQGSWHRILRLWGPAPVALIGTSSSARNVLDLAKLIVSARVVDRGRPVATRWTSYGPYGYSSVPNAQALEFDVDPGAELDVSIKPSGLAQPDSRLQAFLAWRNVAIKDAFDSAVLDDQFSSVGKVISIIGGLVLLAAFGIWQFQRRSTR